CVAGGVVGIGCSVGGGSGGVLCGVTDGAGDCATGGIEIPGGVLGGVGELQGGPTDGPQATAIPTVAKTGATGRSWRGEKVIGFLREGMGDRTTTYTSNGFRCQRLILIEPRNWGNPRSAGFAWRFSAAHAPDGSRPARDWPGS